MWQQRRVLSAHEDNAKESIADMNLLRGTELEIQLKERLYTAKRQGLDLLSNFLFKCVFNPEILFFSWKYSHCIPFGFVVLWQSGFGSLQPCFRKKFWNSST